MAKLKYDVTDVEDTGGFEQAPVGLYRGKIVSAEDGESKNKQPMLTVRIQLTHDAKGKKLKKQYGQIWHRVPLDDANPGWTWRLLELIKALGLKKKGTLDTAKIEGEELLVKLRAGKDQDDEYRPEVSKLMPLPDDEEPEDEDEPDEDDTEDEDADEEDDDGDEENDEDEEEEEDDEEEGEDYSEWTRNQLVKEARSRGFKVKKSDDDDDIRQSLIDDDNSSDDEDESDEDEDEDGEEQDYSEWSLDDLKAELKERGLKTTGKKDLLVKRLEKDDESGDDPF